MKKLNITKEQFNRSRYFKDKYGELEYVSESGKLFKTDKGLILKFNEANDEITRFQDKLSRFSDKVSDIYFELAEVISEYRGDKDIPEMENYIELMADANRNLMKVMADLEDDNEDDDLEDSDIDEY